MKDTFSIGELAKLFQVGLQTLFYYDSIGLFSPESRNPKNGYRQYRFDQIYSLATIRYLRKLGYSLDQIRAYMESRDINNTLEMLKDQSMSLQRKAEELMRINAAIQRRIQLIEKELNEMDTDKIFFKDFPQRRYLIFGKEELFYGQELFYLYPTVVLYEGSKEQYTKHFGLQLDYDSEGLVRLDDEKEYPQTYTLTAGKFICGYHVGDYKNITDTIESIRQFCFKEHPGISPMENLSVNYNIIDQFVEQDRSRYITEVQIPLNELDSELDIG